MLLGVIIAVNAQCSYDTDFILMMDLTMWVSSSFPSSPSFLIFLPLPLSFIFMHILLIIYYLGYQTRVHL